MIHDDDDPMDDALRAELRALAPPAAAADDHEATVHVRRAVRLGVAEVLSRREARRRRWQWMAPLVGLGAAGAAAAAILVTSGGVPGPTRTTPDAAGERAPVTVARALTTPIDDVGTDGLDTLDLPPPGAPDGLVAEELRALLAAPGRALDLALPIDEDDDEADGDEADGDDEEAGAVLAAAPEDEDELDDDLVGALEDDEAALLAVDDLDPALLARVADALKGS